MKVLDFGCGTGLLSFFLQPYVGEITGIDTSKGMIEVFDKKLKKIKSKI
jgi:Predicted methyltransferase (contains TPR repeat)